MTARSHETWNENLGSDSESLETSHDNLKFNIMLTLLVNIIVMSVLVHDDIDAALELLLGDDLLVLATAAVSSRVLVGAAGGRAEDDFIVIKE